MKPLPLAAALLIPFFNIHTMAQEKVIRLYDGPAPGSEDWKQTEQENNHNIWNTRVVFNVANPTMAVSPPSPQKTPAPPPSFAPAAPSLPSPLTAKATTSPAGSPHAA